MQVRWILSQFHKDDNGIPTPFAADYGGKWHVPVAPSTTDGWTLVQMYANNHQIEAMKEDNRIVVCSYLFDPRPLPAQVVSAYASQGATEGMNLATLLAILADLEPRHGNTI